MSQWISVKDKLPSGIDSVITLSMNKGHKIIGIDNFNKKNNEWISEYTNRIVTHWMPIPEPPKNETSSTIHAGMSGSNYCEQEFPSSSEKSFLKIIPHNEELKTILKEKKE